MVRRPAVAGMFYPADRGSLERMVVSYLKGSGRSPDPAVAGIVSPHAGYVYSGAVAGAAFASAPDAVDTVLIIAPPHRYPVTGASVFDGEAYATPLGDAPVSRRVTDILLEEGLVFQPQAHRSEHSAEVQIPFVQVRWPAAEIAVVLQGSATSDFSRELAGAVRKALEAAGSTIVVASSDLSHYHSQNVAESKDRKIMDAFLSGDTVELDRALASGGEACGAGPIMTLMHYADICGFRSYEEISWSTSAETSGDTAQVVGYFAGSVGRESG